MYNDDYYPKFLVDKVKNEIVSLVSFLEAGPHEEEQVQAKLNDMTNAINDLQDAFYENDSEIETVARDSIATTVEEVLQAFGVDIDIETALEERDW